MKTFLYSGGKPVTALKAWHTVVDGLVLGYPQQVMASDAGLSLTAVQFATQGRRAGYAVAKQLSQLTGIDIATIATCELRRSWDVTLPRWVLKEMPQDTREDIERL